MRNITLIKIRPARVMRLFDGVISTVSFSSLILRKVKQQDLGCFVGLYANFFFLRNRRAVAGIQILAVYGDAAARHLNPGVTISFQIEFGFLPLVQTRDEQVGILM